MTETELAALVDAEVNQAVAAKAVETSTPPQPVSDPTTTPPVAVQPVTFSQAQFDQAVKEASVNAAKVAAKATADRLEAQYMARQRAPFGAPAVIHKDPDLKQQKPFYWAVKALQANPNGTILFRLGDTPEELEFDGSADAVKAFKAMATTSSGATGEHFIPRIQTNLVTEALYAKTFMRQLPGVTVYPMPGLVADLPKIGAFTAGWTAENNTAQDAGDAVTDRDTLTAKNLTALATLSNQLLVDSNPGIETYVRNGLSKAIGVAFDTGGMFGTNANNQPKGVTTYAGITTTAIGSDDIYTAILKATGRMAKNNLDVGPDTIGVVVNPGTVTAAVTTRVGTSGDFISAGANVPGNTALAVGSFTDRMSMRLGYKVFASSIVSVVSSKASMYVVYAPNVIIGDRQELELAASNVAGNAFANNQTFIRAICRADFALQRTGAIEIISGADA